MSPEEDRPITPSPTATPKVGGVRRALRALTSPRALLQATGVLALAAVAAGAALLLPPSDLAGELPSDEALESIAARSIKANRDYTIPDPEATDLKRLAAAAAVRPVYDFDVAAAERARTRLGLAFSYLREQLALSSPATAARNKNRPRKEPDAAELVLLAAPSYGEFIKLLERFVDEPLFAELSRAAFSEELERATVMLASAAFSEEIVERRELLLAERERGITIRSLGEREERAAERDARDVERIPDLALVQGDLARLALGLPLATDALSGLGRIGLAMSEQLDPASRRAAANLASRLVTSNLQYNREETERRKQAAAAAVKPVVLQYARGEKIIGDGERIEKRHLLVFRFVREQARTLDYVQVRGGAALFTVLLVLAVFRLARRTVRRFRPGKRDLVFLAAALLGNLALLRAVGALAEKLRDRIPALTTEVGALLLPLAAGTMLVRMLRSGESSVVFALIFSPLVALQLGEHAPAAVGLVASVVAADRLGRRAGRAALPLASIQAGLAAALTVAALALFGGRLLLPETALQAAAALLGAGLLSPLAAALIAPLFETTFGYTSESQLSRLASLNHPVLKELIIKAPGTYHHSVIVGTLAEAAAKRIGAHPLMARVGGYYHDLGKADAPLMFFENQKTENRLEKLPPEAAAVVLLRHVSEGVARAQAARLPRIVLEFIRQHHGTRPTGSFLQRAREYAEREGLPPPNEADFHYPGPKPRSRETALVMLADAVEAASRGLAEPSPERLQSLVPKVVEPIVLEGQLDECDLTLADVRLVIEAFQETIVDIHGLSRIDVLPPPRPPTKTPSALDGAGPPPIDGAVRALRP